MDKVLNKVKLRKSILFIIVIFAIMISMFFLFNKESEYKELPKVKLKEQNNNTKQFALMLEQDNGEYKESDGELPTEGYVFNKEKSECTDVNGKIVNDALDYDYENYIVLLDTSKTLYCYLYYDKEEIIDVLRKNDLNKILSSEEVGGMYRYQGVGVSRAVDATHKLVDNNYICFGTNAKDTCLGDKEKYMYRIIGITSNNQLKLIKMQPIEENENKLFQWWINSTDNIEWPDSLLFKRLNGLSKGETTGDLGDTNIFVNSSRYEYMNSNNEWYNLIVEHKWMYGDIFAFDISEKVINGETIYGLANNGLIIYDIETGIKPTTLYDISQMAEIKYQWNKYINAKIGLMYLHDYYLAYDNERNWVSEYDKTNWLYKDNNNFSDMRGEWHITRHGGFTDSTYSIYDLRNGGGDNSCFLKTGLAIATRPVFYVTNDIQLSGKGTIDNPFILNF